MEDLYLRMMLASCFFLAIYFRRQGAMEDLYLRMMLGGGFGNVLDVATLLGLALVSALYFLAPVAGYLASTRSVLLGSLWVMVGKVALGLFKLAILFYLVQESKSPASGGLGKDVETVVMLFSLLEGGLFVLALVLFAVGLANLRRHDDLPPFRRPFGEE